MHTPGAGTNAVPAFLTKLWKLVDDPSCDDLISWSANGSSFIIHNQSRFSKELLPLYFKHNNLASFIRQLNMYGFRKVVHLEQNGLREDMEFYHHLFVKGSESLLSHIKRKVPVGRGSSESMKVKPDLIDTVLENVQNIQGRQESVDIQLEKMKRENEALWREVALLRQKHMKQQQIVEKLIQFLVTIVQPGCNVGLKRKQPLMIDNANCDKKVRSSKAKPFAHLGADFQFTLDPNGTSAGTSTGPVIHDVTESLEASEFLSGTSRSSPVQGMVAGATTNGVSVESPVSSGGNVGSPVSASLDSPLNSVEQAGLLDLLNPLDNEVNTLTSNCSIPTPNEPVQDVLHNKSPSPTPLNTPPSLDNLVPAEEGGRPVAGLVNHVVLPDEPDKPVANAANAKDVKSANSGLQPSDAALDASQMQVAISDSQLANINFTSLFENEWKSPLTNTQSPKASIADHVDGVDSELEMLQDCLPSVAGGLQVDHSVLLGVCHPQHQQPSTSSSADDNHYNWSLANLAKLFSPDEPMPNMNMIMGMNSDDKDGESIQCSPDILGLDWTDPAPHVLMKNGLVANTSTTTSISNSGLTTSTASLPLAIGAAPTVNPDDFLTTPPPSLSSGDKDDEASVMEELFADALEAKIMEMPSSPCPDDDDSSGGPMGSSLSSSGMGRKRTSRGGGIGVASKKQRSRRSGSTSYRKAMS